MPADFFSSAFSVFFFEFQFQFRLPMRFVSFEMRCACATEKDVREGERAIDRWSEGAGLIDICKWLLKTKRKLCCNRVDDAKGKTPKLRETLNFRAQFSGNCNTATTTITIECAFRQMQSQLALFTFILHFFRLKPTDLLSETSVINSLFWTVLSCLTGNRFSYQNQHYTIVS